MATALLDFAEEARLKFPYTPKKKKRNEFGITESESEGDDEAAEEEQEPEQPPNEGQLVPKCLYVDHNAGCGKGTI